jgi:hypothetical protein
MRSAIVHFTTSRDTLSMAVTGLSVRGSARWLTKLAAVAPDGRAKRGGPPRRALPPTR